MLQPPHAERDPGRAEQPAVVGAAMGHDVRHPDERFLVQDGTRATADLNHSTDPAHVRQTLVSRLLNATHVRESASHRC